MKYKSCFLLVVMVLFLCGDLLFTQCCDARMFSVQPRVLVEREFYCLSDTIQLTTEVTGGEPPYAFFWQEEGEGATSQEQSPLINFVDYGSRSISVTATDATGQVATARLTLDILLCYAPGAVKGRIVSKDSSAVGGAKIFVGINLVAISLSTGDYFLQSLPENLTMEINVPGYSPFEKEIPIDPYVTNTVDITLDRMGNAGETPTLQLITSWETITLLWDFLPQYEGYTLYFAPYPDADYLGTADMGDATRLTVTLWNEAAFYVAVTGYGPAGEGGFSNIGIIRIDNFF